MAVYKMTPTKGNLIKAKKTLDFSKKGYNLLDKKRTVLIKEMMGLMKKAQTLQDSIEKEFDEAYELLTEASITVGTDRLEEISHSISHEKEFDIIYKSVMGVEVPNIVYPKSKAEAQYGFFRTIYELAEMENAVYKLGKEIKKTQKRANALDKIQIPKYEQSIKDTEDILAEKEREEFFRLKMVKKKKK